MREYNFTHKENLHFRFPVHLSKCTNLLPPSARGPGFSLTYKENGR